MRRRIYEIVQRAQPGDGVSRAYDIFIVVVAFASIVPLMFKQVGFWLNMLDVVTVYILFLDYILRWMTQDFKTGQKGWKAFAKYPFTPLAIIDLLAILPSLGILPETFKFLRILRIVKIFRYSKNLMLVGNVFVSEKRTLLSVLVLAIAYIFISGLIMFTNEPDTFDNFFDALYWATTVLTTVGYGDVYPVTELGKAISMISSLFGIAVIALPAGIITGGFLEEVRKRQNDGEAYYRRHDLEEFKGKPLSAYSSFRGYIAAHPKMVYYAKIMALGVVLNTVLYMCATWLKLPIWLDTTGTALVAFLLEPAAALLVGYANNLILAVMTGDAGNLLYYALSAIVALVYGIMFARGKAITKKTVLWAAFCLVVVSAALSTGLSYLLDGGVPDLPTDYGYWQVMVTAGIPQPIACFLALAADRLLDNLAVFALVFGITRVLPRRDFAEAAHPAPKGAAAQAPDTVEKYALGVDVGGTTTKLGIFTFEGVMLGTHFFDTVTVRGDSAFSFMEKEYRKALEEAGVEAEQIVSVGLALPGAVAAEEAMRHMPNVDLDLKVYKTFLHSLFPHVPVAVINDANAAVLGDLWHGSMADREGENIAFLTLGTGVGAGIVLDGSLIQGTHGAAGEVGHMCVNPDESMICKCGKVGCLEQYASATGVIRMAREEFVRLANVQAGTTAEKEAKAEAAARFPNARAVFDACDAKDAAAVHSVDMFTTYLGFGLAQLACTFDPDAFVLGGGVAGSAETYIDDLRLRYRERALPICRDTAILPSKLGNDCGMYGAAYFGLSKYEG